MKNAQPQQDYVKLALPKGKLVAATSCLLNEIGLGFQDYNQESRTYRLQSTSYPNLSAKMFQEKDVPIQVSVGNYDLGICGIDWIEELSAKYPGSALVKLADLEYDKNNLYLASSQYGNISNLSELSSGQVNYRIVSEYPNLAESTALSLRLKRFRIFPVWGAAEAYPPENADLVLLRTRDEIEVRTNKLVPLMQVLPTSAFLIANRYSLQTKNIGEIMSRFSVGLTMKTKPWQKMEPASDKYSNGSRSEFNDETVWLAIPDGHQQKPTIEFLNKTGLQISGYTEGAPNRRPTVNMVNTQVKVIRPQDMPLQVANANFDLAITGKDWLLDHLYRFPSSPVTKLVDLGFGTVTVVAVVSQNLPASNISDLKQLVLSGKLSPLRVATEYTNIADRYLRDKHVSRYKLIPTWGASEAFLPEDADLLIENTETGKTLATNKLRIIDGIFQSTACLIGNKNCLKSRTKRERISSLVKLFRQTVKSN